MTKQLSGLLGEDQALETLNKAVKTVSADHCEAVLLSRDQCLTRYANNAITQNGQVRDAKVSFRVVEQGNIGVAFTNNLSQEGLNEAGKRATELAKCAKKTGTFPGFPSPQNKTIEMPKAFMDHTAQLPPQEKADHLSNVFSRGKASDVVIAGSYHTGAREFAIANNSNLTRYFRQSVADAKLIALDGHTSGYAGSLNIDHQAIDLQNLAETSIEKCINSRKPVDIDPGSYDVILEPEAVAEIMEWLGFIGFSSKSYEDKMSFQYDRIGEQVTGKNVTIYDDGHCESGVGLPTPFDGEGLIKEKISLIDNGIAKGVVWDTLSGSKSGCASTGHALPCNEEPNPTAAPGNLVFAAGSADRNELLARTERGLWVTRFHYVNGFLEPKKALMTGLTRDGTFLIENGKLTKAVRNLRFTDSILEAFSRIDGISKDLKAIPTWWSTLGAYVAPTILVRGLKFNGVQSE